MRIGYAGQNGREYTGIGGVMRERGLLGDGPGQYPGSMQGIMQYLREHPAEGRALMRENKSWVFFRELTATARSARSACRCGAQSSVAADPAFVPLGAPVWLDLDRREATACGSRRTPAARSRAPTASTPSGARATKRADRRRDERARPRRWCCCPRARSPG